MSNKNKKKVCCAHKNCTKYGFLSVMELSCLEDVEIPWMCKKHDEMREIRDYKK